MDLRGKHRLSQHKPLKVATIMPEPPRLAAGDYILGNPYDEGSAMVAMPREGVHLISGSSGSGKTTLLFTMIKHMQEGKPFMGYPTKNVPLVYLSMDRTGAQTENTMDRVGLARNAFPYFRCRLDMPDMSQDEDDRLHEVIRAGLIQRPDAKLIIIDGFTMLAPHGRMNDYLSMAVSLQRTTDFLAERDIALIGLTHSPKQRADNKIPDPRQLVIGSTATPGSCASVIVVEKMSHKPGDYRRRITIMARDLPEETKIMNIDSTGQMVEEEAVESATQDQVEMYMCGKKDKVFTPTQLQKEMDVPHSTVERALKRMLASQQILRISKGKYQWADMGVVSGPGKNV